MTQGENRAFEKITGCGKSVDYSHTLEILSSRVTSTAFGQGKGTSSCLPGALQKPAGSSHTAMGREDPPAASQAGDGAGNPCA